MSLGTHDILLFYIKQKVLSCFIEIKLSKNLILFKLIDVKGFVLCVTNKKAQNFDLSSTKVKDIFKHFDNLTLISINQEKDQYIFTIGATLKKEKKSKVTLDDLYKMMVSINTDVNTRFDGIETRLDKIENCPTIQKELGADKR